jgi:hypothetical protein
MPPLPDIAQVIKCRFVSECAGESVGNTLHLFYTGDAPTPGSILTMAESAYGIWGENITVLQSSQLTLIECDMMDLTSSSGSGAIYSHTQVGGGAAGAESNNDATCINWQILRRYRGGKPRSFIGGVPAGSQATPTTWESDWLGAIASAAAGLLENLPSIGTGGTVIHSVGCVSYYDKTTNPEPPYLRETPLYEQYFGAAVQQRICSQRRRLGKS